MYISLSYIVGGLVLVITVTLIVNYLILRLIDFSDRRLQVRSSSAREKEFLRRQKHDAKVAAMQEEISAMNEELPAAIVFILSGLSLGDQRIYHIIRQNNGILAKEIAVRLPELEGVKRPSIATVKRSISALAKAGLIERNGDRKTGKYIATRDINVKINF